MIDMGLLSYPSTTRTNPVKGYCCDNDIKLRLASMNVSCDLLFKDLTVAACPYKRAPYIRQVAAIDSPVCSRITWKPWKLPIKTGHCASPELDGKT